MLLEDKDTLALTETEAVGCSSVHNEYLFSAQEDLQVHFPANNAMQGPCGSCKGCLYGTRTDLAAGTVVAPHELTARV